MGRDDTTERLFPHQMVAESQEVERPIPLARSPREEVALLRLFVEDELKKQTARIDAALQRLSPVHTPVGALRAALPVAGKVSALVGAVLALLEVVVPMVAPQWEGPLKALRQAFGAPQ
jgi:hypothetical protein